MSGVDKNESQASGAPHPLDWETRARVELGETPEVRNAALKELAAKAKKIEKFNPRLDESFLLRFLRAKKFDVDKAFKSYKKFHTIRLIDPERYLPIGVGPLRYKPGFDLATGTQLKEYNPIDGCFVVIWRVGNWHPECGFDLSDIFTPTAMGGDFRLREDQAQVAGCHMVMDLGQMHLSYIRHFPFSAIKALIMTIQDGYPCRFKGFHVVNNSSLWDYLWAVAKPFLKPKIKDRVYLHGTNVKSLHKHICPTILPEEYGGGAGPFDWSWITGELYARNEEFIRLSHYGYIAKSQEQRRDG